MFESLYKYLYHLEAQGGISLKGTGIVLGLLLLASHIWALMRSEDSKSWLRRFPRSYPLGALLLTIDFLWAMMLLANMDMGEFFFLRRWFLMLVPIGFVLVLTQVKEFLSVRALGALMLLAASPVLTAAFLHPQLTRLLLPILAYGWIIIGMFFIGMPYLMRDWITWVTASDTRWRLALGCGAAYGAVLLLAALLTY